MKKLMIFIISILMTLICSSTGYGQKIMKLEDELKANSTPMEARIKGISLIGKYQFGPYRIVSGKDETATTTSGKENYGSETIAEPGYQSSFLFTVNDKDTILVNTMINADYSESERAGFAGSATTLNGSFDNYTALISPYSDTTLWKMILVSTTGVEVLGNLEAEGILTNGVIDIQIREIKQWEGGKNTFSMMVCGYGFFIDDKEIAAVQKFDDVTRKYVWLHQNLDERMKSVLAAASASILTSRVEVAPAYLSSKPVLNQDTYKLNPDQFTGQNSMSDVDMIAFFVPDLHKKSFEILTTAANVSDLFAWGGNLYQFDDRGSKEIQYGDLQSTFIQNKADPELRNIADGALTLVTGIGFGSTDDGRFEVSGKVNCNDSLPAWNVIMFCEGYRETERERVNNDNSTSVVTSETYIHFWDKNATGILIEGMDTIGFFRIIMNPREDSLLKPFSADLLPHQQDKNSIIESPSFSAKTPVEIDFGVSGTFGERNFFILSDGAARKTWIFMDNEFMSMFQEYKLVSKKEQIMPYLLINKNIPGPDRRDLIRIAIMSRCLNAVLN
jgi:hypothetical protein